MLIPPRHDPRRPLAMAILTARILGAVMLAAGGLLGVMTGQMYLPEAAFAAFGALLFTGFGLPYLLLSFPLAARRRWALSALIVLATINCLIALILLVLFTLFIFVVTDIFPISVIPALVTGAWLVVLWHFNEWLGGSYRILDKYTPYAPRGFEPILRPDIVEGDRRMRQDGDRRPAQPAGSMPRHQSLRGGHGPQPEQPHRSEPQP